MVDPAVKVEGEEQRKWEKGDCYSHRFTPLSSDF